MTAEPEAALSSGSENVQAVPRRAYALIIHAEFDSLPELASWLESVAEGLADQTRADESITAERHSATYDAHLRLEHSPR